MGANPQIAADDPRRPVDSSRIPIVIGAIALVAVAFVGGLVLIGRATQDDDATAAGTCVADLMTHLPSDATSIDGADLAAARDAGFDDSDFEALVASSMETGVRPDPVLTQVVTRMLTDAELSHDSADVDCWVATIDPDQWVAQGDFDVARVEGSDIADSVAVNDDGSLIGGSDALLDAGDEAPPLAPEALDALGPDVVAFSLLSLDDGTTWFGIGLARGSGDWELALSWSFADRAAAEAAEADVRGVLDGESRVPEMVSGDLADDLTRDGATLSARGRMSGEPTTWLQPLRNFDAIVEAVGG